MLFRFYKSRIIGVEAIEHMAFMANEPLLGGIKGQNSGHKRGRPINSSIAIGDKGTSFERSALVRFIAKASKAARKGKIFIDYLRNDLTPTSVSAFFCARLRFQLHNASNSQEVAELGRYFISIACNWCGLNGFGI